MKRKAPQRLSTEEEDQALAYAMSLVDRKAVANKERIMRLLRGEKSSSKK